MLYMVASCNVLYNILILTIYKSTVLYTYKGENRMSKIAYCNKCGKQLDIYDKQEDFSLETRVGYGSKYDGRVLNLDLCCSCMDELIDSCLISPIEDEEYTY